MSKTMKRSGKKVSRCCICGKPAISIHSHFCHDCARLAFRMRVRRFSPEAEEAVWDYIRSYGHHCYYTRLPLEMDDTKSPWYCVFDHLVPLDPSKIVLTCALVNEMKTALCEREFWFYVEALDDYKHKGKKIKKINLAYWRQHIRGKGVYQLLKPQAKPKWPKGRVKKCCICHQPVFKLRSKYCLRCSLFNHRMEIKGFSPEAVEAIREHLRTKGYVCQLTGLPLEMKDYRSPWYCVFSYVTPGDHSKVVLTCALFGEMKSDLTLKEFWYYIRQLANYRRYHTKIRKKKPVCWNRVDIPKLH